jgi:hypothetical protein
MLFLFLTAPFFVSAQTAADRNEMLIGMLTQLVNQFEQEIAALSSQSVGSAGIQNADDTLSNIKINGIAMPNFSQNNLFYNYLLPSGTDTFPVVTAQRNNISATEVINQANSVTRLATISVTAQDGITNQTYIINFSLASK